MLPLIVPSVASCFPIRSASDWKWCHSSAYASRGTATGAETASAALLYLTYCFAQATTKPNKSSSNGDITGLCPTVQIDSLSLTGKQYVDCLAGVTSGQLQKLQTDLSKWATHAAPDVSILLRDVLLYAVPQTAKALQMQVWGQLQGV